MRPWLIALVLVTACKRLPREPSNVLDVADEAQAGQLVHGFYPIEEGKFRWTERSFGVRLKASASARHEGARLVVQLFVPAAIIAHSHGTTMDCTLDGAPLGPERFTTAGSHKLVRDTAPLAGEIAALECTLSDPVPPEGADLRELGVVVSKIRLLDR